MKTALLLFTILLFLHLQQQQSSAAPHTLSDVVSLRGASSSSNGIIADSTKDLLGAWATACAMSRPATIYVPPGKYLLRKIVLSGRNCKNDKIEIKIDGVLVAPEDYNVLGHFGNWISFEGVNGVSINGGVLDGRGSGLWACKDSNKHCPLGATTLAFTNSKNVVISRLKSMNSQMFHIVINGCHNVKLQQVMVSAPANSPNTDGIHVQLSSRVTILNSRIGTGDDCVSIGPGTTGLWIEDVACGPGHGISIGSLGKEMHEPGVENVTVKTTSFRGTQNGLRIKTWGRPSNGFVRDVLFQHAIMVDVQNPIVIDQNYCPNNHGCPGQASGIKIENVIYDDIHGTSDSEVAMRFDCSKTQPCSGIRLHDVNLYYKNKEPQSACANARGKASGFVQPASCL